MTRLFFRTQGLVPVVSNRSYPGFLGKLMHEHAVKHYGSRSGDPHINCQYYTISRSGSPFTRSNAGIRKLTLDFTSAAEKLNIFFHHFDHGIARHDHQFFKPRVFIVFFRQKTTYRIHPLN